MHSTRYVRDIVTILLDEEEWIEMVDSNDRKFLVREVTVVVGSVLTTNDTVAVRGWGVKKDGTRAFIQRSATCALSRLPRDILEEIIKTLRGKA